MENRVFLQDIFIYPIKSLGGIRLESAQVEERGFQYDRRWMLVDSQGRFVSQQEYPELALLSVKLENESILVFSKKNPEQSVEIPINLSQNQLVEVEIWDDRVQAELVSSGISEWFSRYLGFQVTLVKMPETTSRKVDPRYAVNGESVSFADGMPYLLISQESLDELNSRLEAPVPMDRFRPNLVIKGGGAYLEDELKKIEIGKIGMQIVKPCARCVLTTVDQETGEKGKEPLKTLSSYRTQNNKVYFGQNVVALGTGLIRIGDPVIF